MKPSDSSILTYRRQYIISPREIECPFLCKMVKLNKNFILYAHEDLLITEQENNNTRIILVGDMFDYDPQIKSNSDILKELIDDNFYTVIEKTARYSGRYLILFLQADELYLLHDNTAARKIFYANIDGAMWFASQPYLLGNILNLKETVIPSKIDYYNSDDFVRSSGANVGNTTIYDEIHQVLPNHYFDVQGAKVIRFFPNRSFEPISVLEAEKKSAEIVRGYMENIAARYNVMLPVTAGKDSRLLFAATKNIRNRVYYYLNKTKKLDEKSADIRVPKSLLEKLGLEFHLIDPYVPIDEDFKSIYFQNNRNASLRYLPMIYNYYLNYSNKVNLPGNIAFDPFFLRKHLKMELTPVSLAEICHVKKYDFAREYYSTWLSSIKEICKKTGVKPLSLFYWEERIGNWGTQIQVDKDIAQEEFNPYNSRMLTCLFLSIDYRLLSPPNYIFHREAIKYLWPEALLRPINPGLKNNIKKMLEIIGIYNLICRIKSYYIR